MTTDEATEIMRDMVGEPAGEQCQFMMAAADVWEEAEEMVGCGRCNGVKRVPPLNQWGPDSCDCPKCHATGFVSNGNSLRAEALRLLAECGKCGDVIYGYVKAKADGVVNNRAATVENGLPDCVFDALEWQLLEWGFPKRYSAVDIRLAILDAYAAADRPTREAWAREMRKLAGWVACRAGRVAGIA